MAEDLFEFQAVPKFIDFHNENDDVHERSAFFKGDVVLQPTPRAPPATSRLASSPKTNAPENFVVEENAENIAPSTVALKASSDLALFNHGASRVAEKVRRRSQQIKAPPEEPAKEPRTARSRTGTSAAPRPRSSSIQRNPSQAAAVSSEKPTSSIPRLRSSSIQRNPPQAAAASSEKPTSSIPRLRSSSIQRNPSQAEKERIQAPHNPPPFTRMLRSYKAPTGTTPIKPLTQPSPFPFRRSSSRCRDTKPDIDPRIKPAAMDPRIRASIDRLATPKKINTRQIVIKEDTGNVALASSNLALFNHGASRVAEKVRRRSQQVKAPPEEPAKEPRTARSRTGTSAASRLRSNSIQRNASQVEKERIQAPYNPPPFTRILRSYKTPTGTTPMKTLTQPNPFPFRRSSSRCRDTKSDVKPAAMDPRIRASIDRLAVPKKINTRPSDIS